MRWPQSRKTSGSPTPTLAGECEAFLSGRSAELLRSEGKPPPPWAWLNKVAHASPAQVRALADRSGPRRRLLRRRHRQEWQGAVAAIASRLMELADGDPGKVRGLQAAGLVPLELDLMTRRYPWLHTPELLAQDSRSALLAAVAGDGPAGTSEPARAAGSPGRAGAGARRSTAASRDHADAGQPTGTSSSAAVRYPPERLAAWRTSARQAERADCCPARPTLVAVIPPALGRSDPVDLLLCRHHHRAHARALATAGATVISADGQPPAARATGGAPAGARRAR